MTADSQKLESARTAIGIITAWLSEPDGGSFTASQLEALVNEGGEEAIVSIVSGLITVAGHLLIKTAAATGKTEQEVLQEMAAKYAR